MSFITKQELASVIYEENIDVITRKDDSKVTTAIQTAVTQAEGYLYRYDTDLIFASTGADRDKYAILITYIKDLAKWHLIAVCNASVDLELSESRYKAAIKGLETLQKEPQSRKGWPLPVTDTDTPKAFRSGSKPKFNHSY